MVSLSSRWTARMDSEQARVSWRAWARALSRFALRRSNFWRIWSAIFSSLCIPYCSFRVSFLGTFRRMEGTKKVFCQCSGHADLAKVGFVAGKIFGQCTQEKFGAERTHEDAGPHCGFVFARQDLGKIDHKIC